MAIKLHPSIRVHPGCWLKADVVDHYGMTISRVAEHLGVTRPAMSNLLNGKAALSPEMAIRFEKAFGISAETMMRMQAAWDLAQVALRADAIKVERWPEAA
jgi:antitoxin HigA-1